MLEFFEAFGTIGVWGLLLCVILYIIVEKVKAHNSRKANKDKNDHEAHLKEIENEKDERMLEIMEKMQEKFCETIIQRINNGVTHTVEDEERNCRINAYLDETLQCLLDKTHAHRAFIFSYHNGERSIDGRGYQKMSITNERTVSWVSPIMGQCQNLQRAMLASIYTTLISNDQYYIKDIEDLKDVDTVAYDFIKKHGTKSLFMHSLKRDDGLVTGFIGIEYVNDVNFDIDTITKYLEKKALKVTGAILGDNSDFIKGVNSNE